MDWHFWLNVAQWGANVIAVPAVRFIWNTQTRITRLECKVDLILEKLNPVQKEPVKPQ